MATRSACLVALCVLTLAGTAQAEPNTDALDTERPPQHEPRELPRRTSERWCSSGADHTRCRTFWLTESALFAGDGGELEQGLMVDTSVAAGVMRNVGTDWALGAAVYLSAGSPGLGPRLRCWLDSDISLEAGVGPLFGLDNPYDGIGVTSLLMLRLTEYVAPSFRLDILPTHAGGTDLRPYGGFTLGAEAGAVGIGLVFGVRAVLLVVTLGAASHS